MSDTNICLAWIRMLTKRPNLNVYYIQVQTWFHVHRNVHGCHFDRGFLTIYHDHGHRVQVRSDRDRHGIWSIHVFAQQPPRAVLCGVMIMNFDYRSRLLMMTRTHGMAQRHVHCNYNYNYCNIIHSCLYKSIYTLRFKCKTMRFQTILTIKFGEKLMLKFCIKYKMSIYVYCIDLVL